MESNQQGKNCLKTDDGKYCCLGVLTDLAVKKGIIPEFMGGLNFLVCAIQEFYNPAYYALHEVLQTLSK